MVGVSGAGERRVDGGELVERMADPLDGARVDRNLVLRLVEGRERDLAAAFLRTPRAHAREYSSATEKRGDSI